MKNMPRAVRDNLTYCHESAKSDESIDVSHGDNIDEYDENNELVITIPEPTV